MDITKDQVLEVIRSKNFNKAAVYFKGWGLALYELSKLVHELETGDKEIKYHKKLDELNIPSIIKKKTVTRQQISEFWKSYQLWAKEYSFVVPQKFSEQRVTKARNILRAYTDNQIEKAFENATKSKFLRKEFTLTYDWFTIKNNFLKVLEGNYNKPQDGFVHMEGF